MNVEQGAFARATRVSRRSDGSFSAEIFPDWCIGSRPNGGYLLAIALQALGATVPYEDPIVVSSHFLAAPVAGSAEVAVGVVRIGRTLARAEARLTQDGEEHMRVLAAYGSLGGPAQGSQLVQEGPPSMPEPEACIQVLATTPDGRTSPVRSQFDIRYHPESVGWASGIPTGRAEVKAWMRLADGSPPDAALIPLLVDVLPASVYDLGVVGWVPTVEMTIHLRSRPRPGWLLCATQCRFASDGIMEEDASVWDADGVLIATCRQLALLPLASGQAG